MLTQPARLAGTKLLVSASNSVHYLYNVAAPHAGPQACFTGHTTDSFYVKTAFSPDGDHVLSGSSDGHACIWPVRATAFAWGRVQASYGGLVLCLVSALGDFERLEESAVTQGPVSSRQLCWAVKVSMCCAPSFRLAAATRVSRMAPAHPMGAWTIIDTTQGPRQLHEACAAVEP